jgi:hypothetical protein
MSISDIISGIKQSKAAKATLGIAVAALVAALGLGTTGNDIDLGKSIDSGSLVKSSEVRDMILGEKSSGLFSGLSSVKCESDTYNCGDFKNQDEAQSVYEKCGGKGKDIHNLDRDQDGQACTGLPAKVK